MNVDVLVVGAGPTGLTLASELLRRGVGVRIIDKAAAPTTLSKAIAVHARTLEIFSDLGIADDAIARGVRLRGVTMHAGDAILANVDFDVVHAKTRFPFVLSISQAETERTLGELLARRGGAVEREIELVTIANENDGVRATVRGPRGDETIGARWAIGCDGAHSAVRHALGASFEGHGYDETFVLGDVRIAWDGPKDRISTWFSDDGVAAFFPMKDDRWRVIVSAPADAPAPTIESLQAIAEARTHTKAPMTDCAWIAPFKIHCRHVDRYRQKRIFVAGDAAHIHSPVGGQGMNTGIQDAHNLAWKLALAVHGHAREALLESYHAERHAIGVALLRTTDVATKIGTLRGEVATRIRNHVARFVTSFEPVKKLIATNVAELDIAYGESPIVGESTKTVLGARIGSAADAESPTVVSRIAFERAPAPGSFAPDGAPGDGDAFTLLLFDGRSATDEGYASLFAIATATRATHGHRVKTFLVTPHAIARPVPDGLAIVHDDGALERAFGAETECLYLVRPDRYIGFRSQPADGAALADHLGAILD